MTENFSRPPIVIQPNASAINNSSIPWIDDEGGAEFSATADRSTVRNKFREFFRSFRQLPHDQIYIYRDALVKLCPCYKNFMI